MTYDEWGNVTSGGVATVGGVTLDLKNYTGHDYDDVLGLYFAQARLYSSADKRFVAVDIIKGSISPIKTQYVYCRDNPLVFADFDGRTEIMIGGKTVEVFLSADGVLVASLSALTNAYAYNFSTGNQVGDYVYYAAIKKVGANPYNTTIEFDSWKTKIKGIGTGTTQSISSYQGSYINPGLPAPAGGDFYVDLGYFTRLMCDVGKGKTLKLMPGYSVYLSPSLQSWNKGIGNYGSEKDRMKQIADVAEVELKAVGIIVYRSAYNWTGEKFTKSHTNKIVNDSNKKNPTVHVALHSNAGNGKRKGIEIYYNAKEGYQESSKRLATRVLGEITKIAPTSDWPAQILNGKSYAETRIINAPSILIEYAFHDNADDASWIISNISALGKRTAKGIINYLLLDQ